MTRLRCAGCAADSFVPPVRAQYFLVKSLQLRGSGGPQRLHTGNGTKRAETGHVVRMHQLQMGQLCPAVSRAIAFSRPFQGIQRHAHGAVGQGVKVQVETGGIGHGDYLIQGVLLPQREAMLLRARIRLQQRRGVGLGDPVNEDLHRMHVQGVAFVTRFQS
jgi:hypothetical protein